MTSTWRRAGLYRERIVLATAFRVALTKVVPWAFAVGQAPGDFRSTLSVVEIHPSARKHGVADEDIRHAIDHALAIEDAGEDPDRWLVIGPDRAANLLEVVVLVTVEDVQLAIHAMRMRAQFRRLIEP